MASTEEPVFGSDRKKQKCLICCRKCSFKDVIHVDEKFNNDPSRTISDVLLAFTNIELYESVSGIGAFVCLSECYQRLVDGVEFQELIRNALKQLLVGGTEMIAMSDENDSQDDCRKTQHQTTSIEIIEMDELDEQPESLVTSLADGDLCDNLVFSSEVSDQINQDIETGRPFVQPEAQFVSVQMQFKHFDYFELNGERCCGCDFIAKTMDELFEHASIFHVSQSASDSNQEFVCGICSELFATEHELESHRQSRQPEVFVCKRCELAFYTKQRLTKHMMQCSLKEIDDTKTAEDVPMIGDDDRQNYDNAADVRCVDEPIQDVVGEQGKLIEDQFITHQEDYDEYCILHTDAERCCGCAKFYANYEEMLAHARSTHWQAKTGPDQGGFTCEACGDTFKLEKSLKHHQATNTGFKKIFYCKLCKISFVRMHLFARHIMASLRHLSSKGTVNVQEKRHEEELAAIFRQKTYNTGNFSGFGCCFLRCDAIFDDERQLECHVEEVHAVRRLINMRERTSNVHVCNVCQLSFLKEQTLERHRFGWALKKVNICSFCGKGFPNPGVLREHEQVEHTDTQPQFECEQCGKKFKKKSLIKLHMVTHEEYRRFSCDLCGARFRFGHQLKKHQNAVHATEFPYECKYCDRKMPNKTSYDQHMRKHTGERPFECRHQCGRTFSHTTDRRRHEMATHTGEKPHSCQTCGMAYVRKRELQLHFQKNPDHNVQMTNTNHQENL